MPIKDPFKNTSESRSDPADDAFAITPHDTNELVQMTRSIYVGGSGNIALVTANNSTVTFVDVLAGSILPVRVKLVKSTGTTATNLVGLY